MVCLPALVARDSSDFVVMECARPEYVRLEQVRLEYLDVAMHISITTSERLVGADCAPLTSDEGNVVWSGIRTHEAYAEDLKSSPFDRSGIQTLPSLIKEVDVTSVHTKVLLRVCLNGLR